MSNPFTSILTSALKDTYEQAIDALLAFGNVQCILHFPEDKYETCPNCIGNTTVSGPNPFIGAGSRNIVCSMCGGTKKRPVPKSENVSLTVIFDRKKFLNFGSVIDNEVEAQTISRIDETQNFIAKSSYAYLDTANTEHFNDTKYIKSGESKLVGLGRSKYLITNWKKMI